MEGLRAALKSWKVPGMIPKYGAGAVGCGTDIKTIAESEISKYKATLI